MEWSGWWNNLVSQTQTTGRSQPHFNIMCTKSWEKAFQRQIRYDDLNNGKWSLDKQKNNHQTNGVIQDNSHTLYVYQSSSVKQTVCAPHVWKESNDNMFEIVQRHTWCFTRPPNIFLLHYVITLSLDLMTSVLIPSDRQLHCFFLMPLIPYLNSPGICHTIWISDGWRVHGKLELSERLLQKLLAAIMFQQGWCVTCVDKARARSTQLIIPLIL